MFFIVTPDFGNARANAWSYDGMARSFFAARSPGSPISSRLRIGSSACSSSDEARPSQKNVRPHARL